MQFLTRNEHTVKDLFAFPEEIVGNLYRKQQPFLDNSNNNLTENALYFALE